MAVVVLVVALVVGMVVGMVVMGIIICVMSAPEVVVVPVVLVVVAVVGGVSSFSVGSGWFCVDVVSLHCYFFGWYSFWMGTWFATA